MHHYSHFEYRKRPILGGVEDVFLWIYVRCTPLINSSQRGILFKD